MGPATAMLDDAAYFARFCLHNYRFYADESKERIKRCEEEFQPKKDVEGLPDVLGLFTSLLANEAMASRVAIVIVSGSDGWAD